VGLSISSSQAVAHRLDEEKTRSDIRNWIAAPDYLSAYERAAKARHEGTATWIFKHSLYLEWLQAKAVPPTDFHFSPRALWIYGMLPSLNIHYVLANMAYVNNRKVIQVLARQYWPRRLLATSMTRAQSQAIMSTTSSLNTILVREGLLSRLTGRCLRRCCGSTKATEAFLIALPSL
jgi:hypothetical protein